MKTLVQKISESVKINESGGWGTPTGTTAWFPGVKFMQIDLAMFSHSFYSEPERFWDDQSDIKNINKLKPGECWECWDGDNIVIRINK